MANQDLIISTDHGQTALDFMEGRQYLAIAVDTFLMDCNARNLSRKSIKFYQNYLISFSTYAEAQSISTIQDIDPNFIRGYIIKLREKHNPGGVHAAFRSIHAFMNWVEKEDMMPADWKNPMRKVDAPKVPAQIIEPVSLQDVSSLQATCHGNSFFDKRDRAIIFFLLDTGARAQEVCDVNLEDVELNNGQVVIRQGKGGKPRIVFIGSKTIKALRAYLRIRVGNQSQALFVSKTMERLSYDGLRLLIQRRSKLAGLKKAATSHNFRRQFALSMLNKDVNVFSLQKLMGHKDLSVLRRYLAQTTGDISAAHIKGSPVENYRWS